jgi:hypothetical protein
MSGEAIRPVSEEPVESLFALVSEGYLSAEDARQAIESAELVGYFDADRASRWDFFAYPVGEVSDSPHVDLPTSSWWWGRARVNDRTFGFGPRSFTSIIRGTFDYRILMGLPTHVLAQLCHLAGKTIRSMPVEYTSASALAYCLERDGDRSAAEAIWEPYREMVPAEWAAKEFESLFLEVKVNSADPNRDRLEDVEVFQSVVEEGRRDSEPLREYLGLRNLVLAFAQYGQLEKSFEYGAQAISCCKEFLNPAAKQLLGGDLVWLMGQSNVAKNTDLFISFFMDAILETPRYVGNAALFARSAHLCSSHGYMHAQWECVCRLSECIV